ncbi:hypothetical protein, partial [Sphaerisporangium rufum]|uniref:hypothetical protein n=1 Tax=Sphaerisporangium rufum TaxID=1381558 RepID=UPI001951C1C6
MIEDLIAAGRAQSSFPRIACLLPRWSNSVPKAVIAALIELRFRRRLSRLRRYRGSRSFSIAESSLFVCAVGSDIRFQSQVVPGVRENESQVVPAERESQVVPAV